MKVELHCVVAAQSPRSTAGCKVGRKETSRARESSHKARDSNGQRGTNMTRVTSIIVEHSSIYLLYFYFYFLAYVSWEQATIHNLLSLRALCCERVHSFVENGLLEGMTKKKKFNSLRPQVGIHMYTIEWGEMQSSHCQKISHIFVSFWVTAKRKQNDHMLLVIICMWRVVRSKRSTRSNTYNKIGFEQKKHSFTRGWFQWHAFHKSRMKEE